MNENIIIIRQASCDTGTPGDLIVEREDGQSFQCKTLELPWRGNEPGKSCILPGQYLAALFQSPHLQRIVIKLADKNGRQDCEIHPGNWAGDVDKGFFSNVIGCTLVGAQLAPLAPPGRAVQPAITGSSSTLNALLAFLGPNWSGTATYQWATGTAP